MPRLIVIMIFCGLFVSCTKNMDISDIFSPLGVDPVSTGGGGSGGGGGGGSTTSTGKVTITYTRANNITSRPPRTAVWIENSSGTLVKTLYRSVGGVITPFPVHLDNWEAKSGIISDNTPDTYTSASVNGGKANTTFNFVWDCKDKNNVTVSDGIYYYRVEIARYDTTHPPNTSYNSGMITKGASTSTTSGTIQTQTPTLLTAISATFTPN